MTKVALSSLRTERKHLRRLLDRLAGDEAKAEGAPQLREQGEVLKVQLHAVPRGVDSVTLAFPWLPEQRIRVQLQRDLSPAQNVERLFRRARGFAQGLRVIHERQAMAQARLAQVEQLLLDHEGLLVEPPPPDLLERQHAWLRQVRALRLKVSDEPAPPPPAEKRAARQAGGQLPKGIEKFQSPGGRLVLAGRNAQANDALVGKLLRGRDLWFHVKDNTGSHVALRCDGKIAPVDAELRACAVLCAHLSGLPKGEPVDVAVAQGRHVRKVKGAPAGSVYVSDERVLRVTVDAAVVDAFYARRQL